jgi:hypothetical protein
MPRWYLECRLLNNVEDNGQEKGGLWPKVSEGIKNYWERL